jgi:hypothetical protein
MEAHLSGVGFKVEPITPERQAVTASERTEWRWQIEPTRTGRLSLHLTLSANLDVAGRSVPRTMRTFEHDIEVEVTWSERTKLFLAGHESVLAPGLPPLSLEQTDCARPLRVAGSASTSNRPLGRCAQFDRRRVPRLQAGRPAGRAFHRGPPGSSSVSTPSCRGQHRGPQGSARRLACGVTLTGIPFMFCHPRSCGREFPDCPPAVPPGTTS